MEAPIQRRIRVDVEGEDVVTSISVDSTDLDILSQAEAEVSRLLHAVNTKLRELEEEFCTRSGEFEMFAKDIQNRMGALKEKDKQLDAILKNMARYSETVEKERGNG